MRKPNKRPRSISCVGPALAEMHERIVIFDIGARGNIEPIWTPVAEFADFIGFEPDPVECSRLNQNSQNSRRKFYPTAIGARSESHPFYTTEYSHSSGLYKVNEQFLLKRFPYSTTRVIGESCLQTMSLDDFSLEHRIDQVDFIKIDVEGAELDVLEGAAKTLADRKVLGIKTELWWDPTIKGQPSYAKLDEYLRANHFRLYDIELTRYPRKTLPAGRLRGIAIGPLFVILSRPATGQVLTGDALYFRDPVGEARELYSHADWDTGSLLRMCVLLDLYGYSDSAIEIAETYRTQLSESLDVDALIDSLVPHVGGRGVSYRYYRAASEKIRVKENEQVFGINTWSPDEGRLQGAEKHECQARVVVFDLQNTMRGAKLGLWRMYKQLRTWLHRFRGPRDRYQR